MTEDEIKAEATRIIEAAQVPFSRAMQAYADIVAMAVAAANVATQITYTAKLRSPRQWRSEEIREKMRRVGREQAVRLHAINAARRSGVL